MPRSLPPACLLPAYAHSTFGSLPTQPLPWPLPPLPRPPSCLPPAYLRALYPRFPRPQYARDAAGGLPLASHASLLPATCLPSLTPPPFRPAHAADDSPLVMATSAVLGNTLALVNDPHLLQQGPAQGATHGAQGQQQAGVAGQAGQRSAAAQDGLRRVCRMEGKELCICTSARPNPWRSKT